MGSTLYPGERFFADAPRSAAYHARRSEALRFGSYQLHGIGRCIVRTVLIIALGLLAGPALPAQGTGAGPITKENLDLPYDAAVEPEDEEETPDLIVFFGQQYEGEAVFFCCGTSGICRT